MTQLTDGSRVAVIGGGPSGSFFGYFLLQMAERVGLALQVEIYEPRSFAFTGPAGCNMCGGIISESLIQNLATEGIRLPPSIIQRRIDSYFLHMDVGSVRIRTPLREMRIAAVARGGGPRGADKPHQSFDAFLLDLAVQRGARCIRERVTDLSIEDGRPVVRTGAGGGGVYDLAVLAVGVNSPLLRSLDGLGEYRPPKLTKAYISEFPLGKETIRRYLANAMHVFLLNIPKLEFAALIPKRDFVTLCLLGKEIDKHLVDGFLAAPAVREVLPPRWALGDFCHCQPRLNVGSAAHPYCDRVVCVGDCGTTRLFKDGIGAAYRTAKTAARTAVFKGVSARDFRQGYLPTCRALEADNRIGRLVFFVTGQIQRRSHARRAVWRMTSAEQKFLGRKRRMSVVLWDTFTGSAPYRSVLLRTLHPPFLGRLAWELLSSARHGAGIKPSERFALASGETGAAAMVIGAGETLYRQNDPSDCMYLLGSGRIELVRSDDGGDRSVGTVHTGDFFGEMALFGERMRPATARSLTPCTVFTLQRRSLVQRLHDDPPFALRLVQGTARRLLDLEETAARKGGVLLSSEQSEDKPHNHGGISAADTFRLAPESGCLGRRMGPAEIVYQQGDRGDCAYVVHDGRLEAVRREGAEEACVAILRAGDFFGEEVLFQTEIRTSTVRTLEISHVLSLERVGLLERVQEDPSLAMRLVGSMAERIRTLETALAHAAVRPAPPG